MGFEVTIVDLAGQYDVELRGTLNYKASDKFLSLLATTPRGSCFDVDLSRVEDVDSSGLGMFLMLREHAGGRNEHVVLRNPNQAVATVLRTADFETLFTFE